MTEKAEKWGRRLFTIGAVVLVLLGLVHSLSLVQKLAPANETERQMLDLMDHYKFSLMGSMRSMSDLMQGFSAAFTVAMIGLGVLDLSLSRERAGLLKRVAAINIIWLSVMVALSLRYFFAAPASFLSAALLIFLLAWLKLPAGMNS